MADLFVDSDEEEPGHAMDESVPYRSRGFGGLCQLTSEADDFGEEFVSHSSAFRRAGRRLSRWNAPKHSNHDAVRPFRMHRAHDGDTPDMNGEYAEGSERADFNDKGKPRTNGTANGDVTMFIAPWSGYLVGWPGICIRCRSRRSVRRGADPVRAGCRSTVCREPRPPAL
ncbi:Dictyostelium kinase [Apiospora arundinis]